MDRFRQAILDMLIVDEKGMDEFDRIRKYSSRKEMKSIELDHTICKELAKINGSTIPLLNALKSKEVLKGIITYMLKDTERKKENNYYNYHE